MKYIFAAASVVAALSSPAYSQRKAASSHRIAAPSSAPKTTPVLPIFSFMGQTTETPGAPFMLGKKWCTPYPSGRSTCTNDYQSIPIGNANLITLDMTFMDGKLASFTGMTISGYYPLLLEAFTLKYGPPTKTEVKKWQNRAGATFDNPTAMWLFKGGVLELDAMGGKVDEASVTFISVENTPPAPKPVINF